MEGKLFLIVIINLSCSFALSNGTEKDLLNDKATVEEVPGGEATDLHGGRSGVSYGENEVEEGKKRNPKFAFAVPFPNIPGIGGDFMNTTPGSNQDGSGGGQGGNGDLTNSAAIGTTAVLIKGGILSGLLALKAAILPPIFLGALILFLIAGAGFFTCSVVNCGRFFGDVAVGGGPGAAGFGGFPSFNPFNRNGGMNGIDEYEQRPVFQALDDSYKKFN